MYTTNQRQIVGEEIRRYKIDDCFSTRSTSNEILSTNGSSDWNSGFSLCFSSSLHFEILLLYHYSARN